MPATSAIRWIPCWYRRKAVASAEFPTTSHTDTAASSTRGSTARGRRLRPDGALPLGGMGKGALKQSEVSHPAKFGKRFDRFVVLTPPGPTPALASGQQLQGRQSRGPMAQFSAIHTDAANALLRPVWSGGDEQDHQVLV